MEVSQAPSPPAVEPAELAETLAGRALDRGALLLATDFDGALAPIVEHPDDARAVPRATQALRRLTVAGASRGEGLRCRVRVAVVTARDAADAAARVGAGPEVVVIGSYGLERIDHDGLHADPAIREWLPHLERAAAALEAALADGALPGAWVERKPAGVVLHTRALSDGAADALATSLTSAVAETSGGLALSRGKRAVELRPAVVTDKGLALGRLRAEGWQEAAVCAAGDDLGDIPMLTAAASWGGTAVAVADAETPAAVLQAAAVRLQGPDGWAETLEALAGRLSRG